MIKSKISAVTAALVMVAGSAVADTQVVGQISASPSAIGVADSVKTKIGNAATPYVQGDVVTTLESASSTLRLSSGKASFTSAPNSSFVVVDGEAGEIALNSGAVEVSAAEGFPITVSTQLGVFEVSAEGKLDAIVLIEDGRFAVVGKNSEVLVSTQDGVVANVGAGKAFSYNGEGEVVEVLAVAGGVYAALGLGGTIAALIAAGFLIDEITDDDDDDDDDASAN